MSSKGSPNRAIITAGILGVLASTYALYVELSVEANPGFKALCDLHEKASCSRVLSSKFGKGFGLIDTSVPICMYGTFFYCLMIFLSTFNYLAVVRLQLLLSLMSVMSSIYLAGVLMFVLYDFCIVCVSTYIINGYLAYLVYRKYKIIQEKKTQ